MTWGDREESIIPQGGRVNWGTERVSDLARVTQHGDRTNSLNPSACSASQSNKPALHPHAVRLVEGSDLPYVTCLASDSSTPQLLGFLIARLPW